MSKLNICILASLSFMLHCKGNINGETCLKLSFAVSGNSELRNIKPVCTKKLFWYATHPGVDESGTKYISSVRCFGQVLETSKTLTMKNSDDQLIDIGTKLNFKEIDCSIINPNPEAE